MKQTIKHTLKIPMFLTVAFALVSGISQASDDFAAGDLSLVIYSLGEEPTGPIATEYYVFNLGPAASFRENTANNVPVTSINGSISSSNIAADLSSVFGPTWANDGKVRMMVVGTIASDSVLTAGDPTRTIYFSKARTSLSTGDKGGDPNAPFPGINASTPRTQSSGAISQLLYSGTNGAINPTPPTLPATSGANPSGVRITTSTANNLSLLIPPTVTTFFRLGTDPAATLDTGLLPGTAGVEAAVDVYRVLNTLTGADLTSGSSAGNAAVGVGQFIGSITLDSSGNLKVQAVGVPASNNYATWATTNGVAGQAANLDHDNDGVINGVEYFLGGPTGNTTGFTALPAVTTVSGVSSITFTKAASYTGVYGTDFVVETSTTLAAGSWTNAPLGAVNVSGTVNISGDNVTFTFPASTANFARLKVTGP